MVATKLPRQKQTAGDAGHHREPQHLWFAEAVQRAGRKGISSSKLASRLSINLDTFQRRMRRLCIKCLGWIEIDESEPEHRYYATHPEVKYYVIKRAIRRGISPDRVRW